MKNMIFKLNFLILLRIFLKKLTSWRLKQFYFMLSNFIFWGNIICATCKTSLKDHMRPNIVLIFADDMGWGDVGANWPETVDTPNLDKLAKNGLRFTDFHVGASVCTPSRAAILTGRLGLRTGVVQNFFPESVFGIPKNEIIIAEVLRDAGYKTAMLGKWHLGTHTGYHPLDKGFHHYLGVPYSVDMGCVDNPAADYPQCLPCERDGPGGGEKRTSYPEDDDAIECEFYNISLPLYADKLIAHQPVDTSYLAKKYAAFARHFISSVHGAPYFLYAALSHIHVPLAYAPIFHNITGRGIFADTLYEMDWLVGQIVKAVEQGQGGTKNTLIWFISDNGPWEVKCHLAGTAGPFVGEWQRDKNLGGGGSASKMTLWEGGHRVPSIIYWPNKVKPGTVSSALTSSFDLMPTFAALAGAELPNDRQFDGINILDLILGRNTTAHSVLFHPNSGTKAPDGEIGAVRIGNYKVFYYTGGTPDCAGVSGPLIHYRESPLVFDLDKDPAESTPLANDTDVYEQYVMLANRNLQSLYENIANDYISVADFTMEPDAKPCCNDRVLNCRCPWD